MKKNAIDILFNDAVDIMLPRRCGKAAVPAAVCVCCGQAGRAMDDDGCGICETCLDAPLQATVNPDGLDFPAAFPHLTLITRQR